MASRRLPPMPPIRPPKKTHFCTGLDPKRKPRTRVVRKKKKKKPKQNPNQKRAIDGETTTVVLFIDQERGGKKRVSGISSRTFLPVGRQVHPPDEKRAINRQKGKKTRVGAAVEMSFGCCCDGWIWYFLVSLSL